MIRVNMENKLYNYFYDCYINGVCPEIVYINEEQYEILMHARMALRTYPNQPPLPKYDFRTMLFRHAAGETIIKGDPRIKCDDIIATQDIDKYIHQLEFNKIVLE